jgi:RNA polymerase sigma factor (TIGR02999 family)
MEAGENAAPSARGIGQMQDPPTTARPEPLASSPAEMFAELYAELRRMADRQLRSRPDVGVSATTLVHEAYLKFCGRDDLAFPDRGRFLAYAARAMRGLVIDAARERRALKRGAGFHITRLGTHTYESIPDDGELERLADAIERLRAVDERLAELVDLKHFCGFTFTEIAEARGVSERTVQRDWEKARLVLFAELTDAPAE